jgi:hypothetical protein
MAKFGLISIVAGISGLLASSSIASAGSLSEELGLTASTLIAAGWLGLLSLLAIAIVLPLVRR